MTRLSGSSATLLLLILACSGGEDDFFKDSGMEVAAGGSGSIDVGVGGTSAASTDGATVSISTSEGAGPSVSTTADGASGSTGGSNGTGGEASTTTTGATTSDGTPGTGGTSAGSGGTGGGAAGTGGSGGSLGSGGDGGGTGGGASGGSGGSGGNAGSGGTDSCSPSDERCDGVDNDCDDDVDEDDVCPTGCFGDTYQGHAYVFCDRPPGQNSLNNRPARNWQQAMQYCLDRDQVLVSLQTSDESDFVYSGLDELNGSGDIWMGATDQDDEDLWSWALGMSVASWEPFYDDNSEMVVGDAFVDWRSGEPNDQGGEDCGVIEVQDGGGYLWDDRSCTTDFDRFVCEDPP